MSERKSPRFPSYRLHKPTGLAVVRLNGKDFYLGKHGTRASHDKYERLIAEWLANHRQLPGENRRVEAGRADLTINELVIAYWRHAETYYVKNGTATGELANIRDAMKPLARLYGDIRAIDFSPQALKAVREAIIEAGLCRGVVNSRVNRIRRMFKWAVENQLVDAGILYALQTVAPLKRGRCAVRESEPVKPVPEAHIRPVLPRVSRQVRAMIQLQLLTGMRPGEATIMRACDLDTTGKIWVYRPVSHKTEHHGCTRLIYLGPQAQDIVRPFLKAAVTGYLFSPRDAIEELSARRRGCRKTPMTPSQMHRQQKVDPKKAPGEHYTTQSYGRAIAAACQAAVVPHWSPNQLRHNAASFLRKQFGIEAAVSSWATARQPSRRYTPSGITPRRLKSWPRWASLLPGGFRMTSGGMG